MKSVGSLIVLVFLVCGVGSIMLARTVERVSEPIVVAYADQMANVSPSEQIARARETAVTGQSSGGWWAFGALLCGGFIVVGLVLAPKMMKEGRLLLKGARGRKRPLRRQRTTVPATAIVPTAPTIEGQGRGVTWNQQEESDYSQF